MHLIWHIARKDIFRLRFHFIAWLGCTLFSGASLMRYRNSSDIAIGQADPWSLVQGLMLILSSFLGYNFFVELALTDSAADDAAFWRSRPISSWKLLSSKLLLAQGAAVAVACAFVGVQLLASFSVFASTGAAFLGILLLVETLALGAFACACVARTSRQCLLLSLAWYVAFMVVVLFSQGGRGSGDPFWESYQLQYARTAATPFVALAGGAAVIVHQYGTLRRRRSIGVMVLGSLLVFATAAAWPFSWPHPTLERDSNAEAYRSVKLSFVEAKRSAAPRSASTRIELLFRVDGLANNESVWTAPSLHHWSDARSSEEVAAQTWLAPTRFALGRDGETELQALGFGASAKTTNTLKLSGTLPNFATARKVASSEPLTYRAEIPLEIWRSSADLRVPFAPSEHTTASGTRLEITRVEKNPNSLEVRILIFHPPFVVGTKAEGEGRRFWAVNRRTGSYRAPVTMNSARMTFSNVQQYQLRFETAANDEDFWKDAELATVVSKRVAVIRRTVEVPQFLATVEEHEKHAR